MTWREYHAFTRHSVESLRRTPHLLDWENMPDPFRHYEGVPVLDLPADPPSPEVAALQVLQGAFGTTASLDGPSFLSQLLFHAAAISASKRIPSTGSRYALRVNPSSGNLHPTEFHFLSRGLRAWPDGLYHYRPSAHMAEQRALGDLTLLESAAPLVFILTSIAWREAWKYRDRAYRYCLHDIGHAWQSLALAAQAMGCDTSARGHFPDDSLSQTCRFPDDEWPMLIVEVHGRPVPVHQPEHTPLSWFSATANRLSAQTVPYPRIAEIHAATKLSDASGSPISGAISAPANAGLVSLPPPQISEQPFGAVARARRSALDFVGGTQTMSLPQLAATLAAASHPSSVDFAGTPFIQLFLYVHRVAGLDPGVYRFRPEFFSLEPVRTGDQRVAAAGLSLGQDLAGNACVAFSMIGDLERATRAHGDRGYRFVHFEAGAVGQRLYLAAQALGLGATGIGAFYDEEVQRYLHLTPEQGQVVYHFSIGHPAFDPRLEA